MGHQELTEQMVLAVRMEPRELTVHQELTEQMVLAV